MHPLFASVKRNKLRFGGRADIYLRVTLSHDSRIDWDGPVAGIYWSFKAPWHRVRHCSGLLSKTANLSKVMPS